MQPKSWCCHKVIPRHLHSASTLRTCWCQLGKRNFVCSCSNPGPQNIWKPPSQRSSPFVPRTKPSTQSCYNAPEPKRLQNCSPTCGSRTAGWSQAPAGFVTRWGDPAHNLACAFSIPAANKNRALTAGQDPRLTNSPWDAGVTALPYPTNTLASHAASRLAGEAKPGTFRKENNHWKVFPTNFPQNDGIL